MNGWQLLCICLALLCILSYIQMYYEIAEASEWKRLLEEELETCRRFNLHR